MPDTLLVLEHHPVVTLGRRARTGHLIATPEQLAQLGVDLEVASRGGEITWHGPGQVVLYPILKLGGADDGLHGYLHALEETAIRTCAAFGVGAFRRDGMAGAWTASGKIAAIGFQFKQWVSLHGMSFNVDNDPGGFALIRGCGLVGQPVATLRGILGDRCPGAAEVGRKLIEMFAEVGGREIESVLEAGSGLP
ncbi:MAG: lipoyl(octanoyl) transferase LipB [Kiritimatiellia bacterium]